MKREGAELPFCCVRCGSTEDLVRRAERFTWLPREARRFNEALPIHPLSLPIVLAVTMLTAREAVLCLLVCAACRRNRVTAALAWALPFVVPPGVGVATLAVARACGAEVDPAGSLALATFFAALLAPAR